MEEVLFFKIAPKKKKGQLKKEMLWPLQVYLLQNNYLESTLQEKFCVDINQYECVHQTSNLHQGIQTTESLPKHKCSREQIASNKLLQRKQCWQRKITTTSTRKSVKKKETKSHHVCHQSKISKWKELNQHFVTWTRGRGDEKRGDFCRVGTIRLVHCSVCTTVSKLHYGCKQERMELYIWIHISVMIRWQSKAKRKKKVRNWR